MARQFYSGKYKPSNPEKYKGDPTNIVYRSSWERNAMVYFDRHPGIIWWASEEMCVPYRSPIDGRLHRYFPDFIIKTQNNETIMIEVKPHKETVEPKKRQRVTKKYLTEVRTWGVNKAKWEAAIEYCKDRKWKFKIITEKELFSK